MSLRIKFNLVLILSSLAGIGLAAIFSYHLLQKNAREEVIENARFMMESAIAVRGYTVSEVKPLLALQQKRQFIKQTVPAYAANQYISKLQKSHPEYSYREATLNPTNPINRATSWEADIINWFRSNADEKELIGERDTPTGHMLYMSRPIQIKNPNCLACHSTPSAAPKTLIDTYGTANGFGWQMNEVIGAQIVSIPMSLPLQRAESTFYSFLGLITGGFVITIVLLNLLLHFIVIKPILTISKQADRVSMGNLEAEELDIKGKDEIASVGQSFNRMHRSLVNAFNMLDSENDEENS